jgi:hypothetical protein
MDSTITLAELRDGPAGIHPHEAVAVAQKLILGGCDPGDAHPPFGPLSPSTVSIDAAGAVHCGGCAATPSVSEVGILLQDLLSRPASRVPGGLRYAISRALLDVEAPPFDTLQDFGATLERFEKGDRGQLIAELWKRARSVNSEGQPQAYAGTDRRHSGRSCSELRRELREADLRLHAAEQALHRGGAAPRVARPSRRGSIAACLFAGAALIAAGELAHSRPDQPATAGNDSSTTGRSVVADAPTGVRSENVAEPVLPAPADAVTATRVSVPVGAATRATRPSGRSSAAARGSRAVSTRAAVRPRGAVAQASTRRTEPRTTPTERVRKKDNDRNLFARMFDWAH